MPHSHLNGEPTSNVSEPSERSHRVEVANETDVDVDRQRIEAAVRLALADTPYDDVAVSVAIVDDGAIHGLNRKFLNHDYPTDVLSFPLDDEPPRLEGEIIVSVDTANRCAVDAGWSGADELLLYVVHGALHLAGHRDKSENDAAEMRRAEAAILAKLGVAVSTHDSRWQGENQEDDSP